MQVGAPPEDGYGLSGSGVFVINPPYTLAAELQEAMPVLWQQLWTTVRQLGICVGGDDAWLVLRGIQIGRAQCSYKTLA